MNTESRLAMAQNGDQTPRNPGRRVTINDLATGLGMVKSTVSRALNNYPDISESTKKRVAKAALEMGYRPHAHAQAIKTGRTRSLGLVLNVDSHNAHKPFLADFIDGISQRASEENWTLTVATANSEDGVVETLRRLVGEGKVDGFILPRTRVYEPRVEFLRDEHFPFILYGRTSNTEGCSWYDIRGDEAMEQAVARLHRFGHSRIGFVNGGRDFNYSPLRLAGYLEGLKTAGISADYDLIREDAVNSDQGYENGLSLIRLPNPPTAIVCALDTAALGLYRAAREFGLEIGKDLSVIGYDGIPEGAYAMPPLTTFAVDTRAAGSRLAALLLERIRGAEPENLRELASAELCERQSDGPPILSSNKLALKVSAATSQRKGAK